MEIKLIFGCGYLGTCVARCWLARGAEVHAVTRSAARAESLRRGGIRPWIGDVLDPNSLNGLPQAETVLYSIGFDRRSGHSIAQVYVEGLRHALDALPSSTRRLVYISSTGVYGQEDGSWVDEDSPCEPVREGGLACLHAERVLRAHPLGSRSIILRMAGLYGSGRIPRAEAMRSGASIAAPVSGYLNLIHRDDAVRAVLLVEESAPSPELYCIADGNPVVREAYYRELARLLQLPPPRFAEPAPDSPAGRRAASSKRVRNARMLAGLRISLKYPSYREGLAAIVAEESGGGAREGIMEGLL